jgi:two-component system chemotaxis response regulator CheB
MSVRVLIIDDSTLVRVTLTDRLSREPGLEVVYAARDPFEGRDKIVELDPDVVTLDIEMPGMNGLVFLRKLMRHYPLPVVVVSSHTPAGSRMALEALDSGAMDIICKPGPGYPLDEMIYALATKIREVAKIAVNDGVAQPRRVPVGRLLAPLRHPDRDRVIAIGASIGGPKAIEHVLGTFPANAPGTLIVQHMPAHFTASFAERLNRMCRVEVREAQDGDTVDPGVALIAPGNRHMVVRNTVPALTVHLMDGPRVGQQRPSVSVLFKSLARCAGKNALAAILTGMGMDGASGLLELHRSGAHTIAQDEATCVVYGMPAEAVRCGAVSEVLPLDRIAGSLMRHSERR